MQSPINIPNGSGAQVRANINGAIESVASFYSGTIDPATLTPSSARPFMVWADTANSLVKQRNEDNTIWANVGTIVDGKFIFDVADTANTLVTPRNINGVAFDGSQDITINTSAEGAYPENFIASGRKITDVTGNQITIGAGKSVMGDVPLAFTANSLTIPARSTSLIADKSDGTTVLVPATYPTAYIDDNTVGFWIFNQIGAGANIPNSAVGLSSIAVANDLVPSGGITSVDGWADYATKLDGTSGYYTSQNSTGIPIGASPREFSVMFTLNSIPTSGEEYIYSLTVDYTRFDLMIYRNTGNLGVVFGGTGCDTKYTLEVGKTYKADVKYTGNILYVFVNGVQIYQQTITLATTGALLTVGRRASSEHSDITLHYLEVRNAPRTDELTAQIANKLCLPCAYTDYSNYSDVTTPQGAIASSTYTIDPYVPQNVFDKNSSTFWASKENSPNISGVEYIGNLFGFTTRINEATIQQRNYAGQQVSSAKLQYTQDNGITWETLDTYPLPLNSSIQSFTFTPIECNGMRWLANSNVSGTVWSVSEVTFITSSSSPLTKNITEILPANSVSLGIVRGDTTGVIMYNDSEYQYGRREGAYGGNRRVFLGWKAFSGSGKLTWDNPFGTHKVKLQAVWAQDSKGTNERDCMTYYTVGGVDYGVLTGSYTTTSLRVLVSYFGGGVVHFNGVYQTSGYIGLYAEVLE